ncbi:hypothetical protein BGZ65_010752, partial [Modicella reniformis]
VAAQSSGNIGNHAGGWGAARVLATVLPVWDELWLALVADGESLLAVASCAAYALGSDYADDVHCSVPRDGEVRYVMYDSTSAAPVILHDVTIRMGDLQEGGQPDWAMAIINVWRDHTMRHWEVDRDMCFDRYVQAYLKKESADKVDERTCDSAGVNWMDVRSWYCKNRGARAGTAEILSKRGV